MQRLRSTIRSSSSRSSRRPVGPSTSGAKLDDYFRLPSVRHYLIVEMKNRTVIHHERKSDGRIETGIVRSGTLVMDPPGIAVEVEGFFAG